MPPSMRLWFVLLFTTKRKGSPFCASGKGMMDLLQLFRRNSSHTTSIIFRSCDIELDNNGSGGTCGHHCCSGLSGFPISYLHDHVSLLVFSLTNPDETLV